LNKSKINGNAFRKALFVLRHKTACKKEAATKGIKRGTKNTLIFNHPKIKSKKGQGGVYPPHFYDIPHSS